MPNEENLPVPEPERKITLSVAVINAQPTMKALMDLPAIEEQWKRTYSKVTGKPDGELRWNLEKSLIMEAVTNNATLALCEKFTFYVAIQKLAMSGLSLREGMAYLVPYSKKVVFIVGWKGRLEQINEMGNVVHVRQPQVVYDCDTFIWEMGERVTIREHTREGKDIRTEKSVITHVYLSIQFRHGTEVYVMERQEVLSIRDRYSAGWKQYLVDCKRANKAPGEAFTATRQKRDGGTWEAPVEPPMWMTDEAQAFKKTLVKRVYNELPKDDKTKWREAWHSSANEPKDEDFVEEDFLDIDINEEQEFNKNAPKTKKRKNTF